MREMSLCEREEKSAEIYGKAKELLADRIRRELLERHHPELERQVDEIASQWAHFLADVIDADEFWGRGERTSKLDRSAKFLEWLDEKKNISAYMYLCLRASGQLDPEQQDLYSTFLLERGGGDNGLKGLPRPSLRAIREAIKVLRRLKTIY